MEYRFYVTSYPDKEPAEVKHQRLFNHWASLADELGPWGLSRPPELPKRKRSYDFTYRRLYFKGPRIKGWVTYPLRNPPGAFVVDSLHIDFDATEASYSILLGKILPLVIDTFSPYELTVADARFREPIIGPDQTIKVGGPRACGGFLDPIFYLSAEAIQNTFNLPLTDFAAKLTPIVEKVSLIGDGALVLSSTRLLPFEEALILTKSIEEALEKPTLLQRLQHLLRPKKKATPKAP